jgi:hypothetical protein
MENFLIINDETVVVLRHPASFGIHAASVFVLQDWRITDRLHVGQIIMEAGHDRDAGREAERALQ